MKRDMDLVRSILLAVEAAPPEEADLRPEVLQPEHSAEEVAEHIRLLHEAGLVRAIDASTMEGVDWIATGLTWEGHEFLDAARDDTRWKRAKVDDHKDRSAQLRDAQDLARHAHSRCDREGIDPMIALSEMHGFEPRTERGHN